MDRECAQCHGRYPKRDRKAWRMALLGGKLYFLHLRCCVEWIKGLRGTNGLGNERKEVQE